MGDRLWSYSAKLLTASLVGLLLAVGLCSVGGGFDTHVTQAQIVATYCGAGLFLASLIGLLAGLANKRQG